MVRIGVGFTEIQKFKVRVRVGISGMSRGSIEDHGKDNSWKRSLYFGSPPWPRVCSSCGPVNAERRIGALASRRMDGVYATATDMPSPSFAKECRVWPRVNVGTWCFFSYLFSLLFFTFQIQCVHYSAVPTQEAAQRPTVVSELAILHW